MLNLFLAMLLFLCWHLESKQKRPVRYAKQRNVSNGNEWLILQWPAYTLFTSVSQPPWWADVWSRWLDTAIEYKPLHCLRYIRLYNSGFIIISLLISSFALFWLAYHFLASQVGYLDLSCRRCTSHNIAPINRLTAATYTCWLYFHFVHAIVVVASCWRQSWVVVVYQNGFSTEAWAQGNTVNVLDILYFLYINSCDALGRLLWFCDQTLRWWVPWQSRLASRRMHGDWTAYWQHLFMQAFMHWQ